MPDRKSYFTLIDPLHPPDPGQRFGSLSPLIAEAATWLFYSPGAGSSDNKQREEEPSLTTILDCVDAAWNILRTRGAHAAKLQPEASALLSNDGSELVDFFCDRYIAKKSTYQFKTTTGRVVGQRHLLCAFSLLYLERVAQGLKKTDAVDVCNSMRNLVELFCEIRRGLDRETGSSIASRRAIKRWENRYLVHAKAIELYERERRHDRERRYERERGTRRSVMQLRDLIQDEVSTFRKELGFHLAEGRESQTIYEWLLAYERGRTTDTI